MNARIQVVLDAQGNRGLYLMTDKPEGGHRGYRIAGHALQALVTFEEPFELTDEDMREFAAHLQTLLGPTGN
jgi:hypothetical protein